MKVLTNDEKSNAYAEVAMRFSLKAPMRNRLDASLHYEAIMAAAHTGDWDTVAELLEQI